MMNVSVAESTGYTNEEGRKVRVVRDIRFDQEYPDRPDEFNQRFFYEFIHF